jgi:4-hydroxy-3-polyprenylbenzoate decarboxylase
LVDIITAFCAGHDNLDIRLSREGAIILPAMPGFYGSPETAMDLVDFMVGRTLDLLGMENDLAHRWDPDSA